MAQTKKKRSRKHRGTPAGTIDRAGRPGSGGKAKANAKAKADPKQAARERRMARINRPPTWRGAVNRAAIAALISASGRSLTTKILALSGRSQACWNAIRSPRASAATTFGSPLPPGRP